MHAHATENDALPKDECARKVHVAGHEFDLFCNGEHLIDSIVRDLAAATKRVWLEVYIFVDDAAGRAVAEGLMKCARAGLDVRLIYDAFGCLRTPSAFFDKMAEAGVKVRAFHPIGEALLHPNFFTFFNRRDHRKLLAIDDRIGYFGGMNIVDTRGIRTVEDAREQKLPKSAGWRDLHARAVGPSVVKIAGAFDRLWQRLHREKVRWPRWRVDRMLADPREAVYFYDCYPSMRSRHARRVLSALIRQAERSIIVSMAYFLPLGSVLRELLRARKRGVRIRVIVPANSDVRLAKWASRHFYAWLMRRGIAIYERKDLMLHSKAMVIDDSWSVIGSCNLDPRSLQLNLEFIGVIHGRAMAEAVRDICIDEMRNSRRVTFAHWRNRTWWQRWLDRAAWSLRGWL